MPDTDWLEGEVVDRAAEAEEKAALAQKSRAEVERLKNQKELAQERLSSIEDELFERSMQIVAGALSAPGLDPANPMEIPQEWIEELGEPEARKRHRAAIDATMNSREAPVYLKTAENMAGVIIRARATEKAAPKHLNIQAVVIPVAETTVFEEMVVEEIK